MSDDYCHLHTHSTYSSLDGYGFPSQFAERCKELGQRSLALTDHGNCSGHFKWYTACKELGIKPILGCEAYVCDDHAKKSSAHKKMWHITLLSKSQEGYRNLMKLISLSWEDGFYYKPRMDWEMFRQHGKGIIATSGCPASRIGNGIAHEGWGEKEVCEEMRRQASIFEDYYVELMPNAYDEAKRISELVYKCGLKEGLPLVLTMDAHYPRPEDAKVQDVMLCIQNNVKFSDPDRMKFSQEDYCLWSGEDMARKWDAIYGQTLPLRPEMLTNTRRIADSVEFEFPSAMPLAFKHAGDKTALLRSLCETGLKERGVDGRAGYRERLEYEFELVVSKNFVDYFLVVADLICWAKDHGIFVGAARGSSCGSLMCYLIRITEIDPIPNDLMVERFIDVSRKDLPDIDIDFESERRNEVKAYLEEKYGKDCVANLATFGTFKGKLCLQDIGRVFSDKIPWEVVEDTKKLIIERSSADSRHGFTVDDTFTNFEQAGEHLKKYPELGMASQLEGQIRQLGVHAAGVVISNEPIGNFAAVYVTKNKARVISMDYPDASAAGLLKIDILGLTVLTSMKRALGLIERRVGDRINVDKIPMDDDAVYENFCRQNLQGIFQFDGESTRQVCRQIQPKNFEDLIAINALSRPGPLHSGGTTSFIERRFGREPVKVLHPIIEDVTKKTYGITVYQEQVMQVVRIMGKFDWSGIATVRKMMSKKYGDEAFSAMRDKFVAGANSQGVSSEVAIETWKNISTFGAWAFNRSHSVAYSYMAYQLMWIKTHFPIEFYAAVIGCEPDTDKQRRLFKEHTTNKGPILPVCVNKSELLVSCEQEGLRLGLDAVVGLPSADKDAIVQNRPYKDFVDFKRRSGVNDNQSEKLLKIGAFRTMDFESLDEQQDLFGAEKAVTTSFNYKQPLEIDIRTHCPLAAENRLYEEWRAWLKANCKTKLLQVRELDDIAKRTDVAIIGCTNPKTGFNLKNKLEEAASKGKTFEAKEGEEKYTKEQYNFLNFNLEDESDDIIVRISYNQYPKLKEMIWKLRPDEPVVVMGMVTGVMRMVFASSVISLPALKEKIKNKQPLSNAERAFVSGESNRRR